MGLQRATGTTMEWTAAPRATITVTTIMARQAATTSMVGEGMNIHDQAAGMVL